MACLALIKSRYYVIALSIARKTKLTMYRFLSQRMGDKNTCVRLPFLLISFVSSTFWKKPLTQFLVFL